MGVYPRKAYKYCHYIFLILKVLWFAFMTYFSHQDGEHTAKTSRELAEKLSFLDIDVGILNGKLRRVAHVVLFAVFTILSWCGGSLCTGIGFSTQKSKEVEADDMPKNKVKPDTALNVFCQVFYFSLKKASEFPFFSKGFALLSAGIMHPCA